MERIVGGRKEQAVVAMAVEDNPAFERALPLLRQILGIGG
jgi:hypothetical protein